MFYYYYEYIANSGCYFKPMKESYSLLTDFNQIRPLLLFLAVPKLCRKLGKGDRERSSSVGESYCLLLGQYCYIFRSMVIDLRFPWYFRCSEKLCFMTHTHARPCKYENCTDYYWPTKKNEKKMAKKKL